MTIWKKIKNNAGFLSIIIISAFFFVGTSSFNYFTQYYQDKDGQRQEFIKWASPDESANYVFTKLYAQEGKLSIDENYNLYIKDIMHPRSFRSDHGILRPMSFLGIILIYGKIASFFSYRIIPFLTPFFASLGIIFFYLLIRKVFGQANAWFSAVLLSVFPPFVYYSARSMFHNVLFVVFVIIGLYCALKTVEQSGGLETKLKLKDRVKAFFARTSFSSGVRGLVWAAVSGISFGSAIIVRSSELLWLLPLLFFLWLFNICRFGFLRLLVFLTFLVLVLISVFYHNQILYGSFYRGGYSEMNQSLVSIASTGSELVKSAAQGQFDLWGALLKKIKDIIFYFGFRPWQSLMMFWAYFVRMFSWLFWPAAFGVLLFLNDFRANPKRTWLYFILWVGLGSVLIAYYGSWQFFDNPDKARQTIGNSYTRYWLPVYLGALPFFTLFIQRSCKGVTNLLERYFRKQGQLTLFSWHSNAGFLNIGLLVLVLIIFCWHSLAFVLIGSEEGLLFLVQRQKESRLELQAVLGLTESNSAIITFYHDKLFFPERKVIVGDFNDKNMIVEYANLAKRLPLYYFNFTFPEKDIEYLNSRRLAEFNLGIELVQEIDGDFSLYRIFLRDLQNDIQVIADMQQ